jgi:hypothetical protein
LPTGNLCYLSEPPSYNRSFATNTTKRLAIAGLFYLPADPTECNPRRSKKATVLWIDMENGYDTTQTRLQAFASGLNVFPEDNLRFVSFPPFNMSGKESPTELLKAVLNFQAGFVVIDNLAASSGMADENRSAMGIITKKLKRIAEHANCSIIVIHHPPKGGDNPRGHGSLNTDVDLALRVQRKQVTQKISVQATKVRHAPIPSFSTEFKFKSSQHRLLKAKFFPTVLEMKSEKSPSKKERTKVRILECYGGRKCDGPYMRTEQVDQAVWDWIKSLLLDEDMLEIHSFAAKIRQSLSKAETDFVTRRKILTLLQVEVCLIQVDNRKKVKAQCVISGIDCVF